MVTVDVKNAKVLGQVLQAARRAKEINAANLAESVNITPQYLSHIENGSRNLFITRLFRLMHRLGITVTLSFDAPSKEPCEILPEAADSR